jgi:hypothetical protein
LPEERQAAQAARLGVNTGAVAMTLTERRPTSVSFFER